MLEPALKNSLNLDSVNIDSNSMFEKLFNDQPIRFFKINEDFYFVGKDIATLLEYNNTLKAVENNCDERISVADLRQSLLKSNKINSLGGKGHSSSEAALLKELHPQTMLITEFDLYALALGCKKPEAKNFQKWVYSVIQEIRKTGSYNAGYSAADINELINKVNRLIEYKTTIEFDGMTKKVIYPSIDIKTFSTLIEKEYKIKFSRNQAYSLLRRLGLVQKNSTTPTANAIKNKKLNIETFPIMYVDGFIGKATRTVILKDTIPDIISYMKLLGIIS